MAESQTKRLTMTLEADGKARRKKETRTTGRSGEKPKPRNRDSKNLRGSLCFKQPEQYPGTTPTYFAPTSAITRRLTSPQTSPPQRFHSATPSPLTSSPSIPANFSFQDDPNMSFYRNSKHFS